MGQKGVEPLTYTSHGLVHKACPVPALLVAGAATPIFLSLRSASLFDFIRTWQPLSPLLSQQLFRRSGRVSFVLVCLVQVQLLRFSECSEH